MAADRDVVIVDRIPGLVEIGIIKVLVVANFSEETIEFLRGRNSIVINAVESCKVLKFEITERNLAVLIR